MDAELRRQFTEYLETQITPLYIKVREAIIFQENNTPGEKVVLGAYNELRAALDHIMVSTKLDTWPEIQSEFHSCRAHINRAGFDCIEIQIIELANEINSYVIRYDPEDINAVFPTYFTKILPALVTQQQILAKHRAQKNIENNHDTQSFDESSEIAKQLVLWNTECQQMHGSISVFSKGKKERRIYRSTFGVLTGVALVAIGFFLEKLFKLIFG